VVVLKKRRERLAPMQKRKNVQGSQHSDSMKSKKGRIKNGEITTSKD